MTLLWLPNDDLCPKQSFPSHGTFAPWKRKGLWMRADYEAIYMDHAKTMLGYPAILRLSRRWKFPSNSLTVTHVHEQLTNELATVGRAHCFCTDREDVVGWNDLTKSFSKLNTQRTVVPFPSASLLTVRQHRTTELYARSHKCNKNHYRQFPQGTYRGVKSCTFFRSGHLTIGNDCRYSILMRERDIVPIVVVAVERNHISLPAAAPNENKWTLNWGN